VIPRFQGERKSRIYAFYGGVDEEKTGGDFLLLRMSKGRALLDGVERIVERARTSGRRYSTSFIETYGEDCPRRTRILSLGGSESARRSQIEGEGKESGTRIVFRAASKLAGTRGITRG